MVETESSGSGSGCTEGGATRASGSGADGICEGGDSGVRPCVRCPLVSGGSAGPGWAGVSTGLVVLGSATD